MKLSTLQAFVVAIEEGSLRGAAKRVNVSQPALSKMIRELEKELAAPLLSRTTRGVEATAQGKVLYEHAVKVQRELGAAIHTIQQLGGQMVGALRISAVPLAVMLLIPETLRTFCSQFPEIQLHVSEELYVGQLQKLREGVTDITVAGIPSDLAMGEFIIEPLLSTHMVVVVRKGSALRKAKTLASLQNEKWVYTSANGDTGYAKLLFESQGLLSPRMGAVVNSTLAMLSLVTTGDYVALMPKQIAVSATMQPFLDVVELDIPGFPLHVGALIRRDMALSVPIRHFLTHLHRAANQLNQ